MLQAGELTTVAVSGQTHSLPLLADYTRIWPLPQGVLLTASPCACLIIHPMPGPVESTQLFHYDTMLHNRVHAGG